VKTLLAAIREKQIGVTHRAKGCDVYSFRIDSRRNQLRSIRFQQIYTGVLWSRLRKEILTGKLVPERIDNVCSDFITTSSSGGTDSDAHIDRFGFVGDFHSFKSLGSDLSQRAAPARMDGGKG
jgi:hypothetical protein